MLWQAFQFTNGNIVALVNTFRFEYFLQRLYDGRFPNINTKGQSLQYKIIVEFIDDECRNKIGFAKYQTAVFFITHLFFVLPCLQQTLVEKILVDLFFLVAS